jgi:hypothetical protein
MGTPRTLSIVRKQFGEEVLLAEVGITGADEVQLIDDVLYVMNRAEQPTAQEAIDASIEGYLTKTVSTNVGDYTVSVKVDTTVSGADEGAPSKPTRKSVVKKTTAKKTTAKKKA